MASSLPSSEFISEFNCVHLPVVELPMSFWGTHLYSHTNTTSQVAGYGSTGTRRSHC